MPQSSGLMQGKRGAMSRGITGEVHHLDSGYHIVGMKHPDAPDISHSAE